MPDVGPEGIGLQIRLMPAYQEKSVPDKDLIAITRFGPLATNLYLGNWKKFNVYDKGHTPGPKPYPLSGRPRPHPLPN